MAAALRALGPPRLSRPAQPPGRLLPPPLPVPVGDWVWHAPLWGNPFLCLELPLTSPHPYRQPGLLAAFPPHPHNGHWSLGAWLHRGFSVLACLPWELHTVADLVRIRRTLHAHARAVQGLQPAADPAVWQRALWGGRTTDEAWRALQPTPHLAEAEACMRHPERLRIGVWALCMYLPPTWMALVGLPLHGHPAPDPPPPIPPVPPGSSRALSALLDTMGWHIPAQPGRPARFLSIRSLTVSDATTRLLRPTATARMAMQRRYVGTAHLLQPAAGPSEPALQGLRQGLAALWRVRCSNEHKEILWRLTLQGVAGAGGHAVPRTAVACPCSNFICRPVGPDDRVACSWLQQRHAFWTCPIAQSVVRAVQAVLRDAHPAWAGPLTPSHLWLLQPPPIPMLQPVVWALVCAVALAAVDRGRRFLWGRLGDTNVAGPQQLTLRQAWGLDRQRAQAPAPVLQQAQRRAVADLWFRLRDTAHFTSPVPKSWRSSVGPAHPFLGLDVGLQLRFTVPAALADRLDF